MKIKTVCRLISGAGKEYWNLGAYLSEHNNIGLFILDNGQETYWPMCMIEAGTADDENKYMKLRLEAANIRPYGEGI